MSPKTPQQVPRCSLPEGLSCPQLPGWGSAPCLLLSLQYSQNVCPMPSDFLKSPLPEATPGIFIKGAGGPWYFATSLSLVGQLPHLGGCQGSPQKSLLEKSGLLDLTGDRFRVCIWCQHKQGFLC